MKCCVLDKAGRYKDYWINQWAKQSNIFDNYAEAIGKLLFVDGIY